MRLAWRDVPPLLLQFLIGGVVVSGISALSTLCSPKDAALVYALPITYIPILVYVWRHARKQDCALILSNLVGQNLAGNAMLLLFCLALYFLVSARTPVYSPSEAETEAEDCPKSSGSIMSKSALWVYIVISLFFMAVPMKMYWDWVCTKQDAACALQDARCVLG